MTKKLFFACLFSLCLVLALPTTSQAQDTYQITETELTRLESILSEQQSIITQLLTEAKLLKSSESESREQLQKLLPELEKMKQELELLKQDLEASSSSLVKANQYLAKYEQEMKRKIKIAKAQRNGWQVAAALTLLGFAAK